VELASNQSTWQLSVFPVAFVAVHERDHANVTIGEAHLERRTSALQIC